MKRVSFSTLLILLFALVGCTSDDPEDNEKPEEIITPQIEFTSSESNPYFTANGGTSSFSFTTTEAWTLDVATRADSWCTVMPTSGPAGSAILSVTTMPNNSYDERRSTVTIKAGTVSKSFTVTQKQKDALLVTSNKVEMKAEGGTATVEVQSNIDYTYKIDDAAKEWISSATTRGLTTHKENFKIAANTDTKKREGKITFTSSSGEFSETVTIYQDGETPSLVLTKNKYEVSSDGETIQVELNSNVDYDVTMPSVDWISESKTRTVSTHTHYFVIKANETYDERNAEITFTNKEINLSEKVTVVQKQKDALLVTSSKQEVDCNGGEITIEVQSNISYEYKIDDAAKEWISKVSTRGLTSHKEIFKIAANSTVQKREGKITFSSGSLSETVTVYQAGESPSIVITKNNYDVSSDGETIQVEIKSNVDYDVTLPSVDWISESKTRTVSTHTHYYVISANSTYDERSTEIVFTNKENNLSEKVTINQKQKNALLITTNSYNIKADGDNITVEVKANVKYSYTIDEAAKSWITKVATRGLTTSQESFKIAANTTVQKREGKITFSSGSLSEIVTVTQDGEDLALSVDKSSVSVGSDGETFEVTVNTNLDYEVAIGADWVTEVKTRTVTGHIHKFNVKANDSSDARSTDITFTNKANNLSAKVSVKQTQKNGLSVSPGNADVAAEGGSVSFTVQSNVNYSCKIEGDAQTWISQVATRSMTSKTEEFRVSANTSTTKREGKITFYSGDISTTVTVTQAGETPVLTVTKSSYSVKADGETIQIEVNSNSSYKYKTDSDWITNVSTRTVTSSKESFKIAANTSIQKREGKITFYNDDASVDVTVTQEGEALSLSVDKSSVSVGSDGETFEVTVNTNLDYEVAIGADWVTEVKTRTVTGHTHKFNVKANDSSDARSTDITFTNKANNLSAKVSVTQSQKNGISVSPESTEVKADGGNISFTVKSNSNYSYRIEGDAQSWISHVATRSMTFSTETFKVSANTSITKREGKITFYIGDVSTTVTVSQAGETPVLTVTKSSYSVTASSNTLDVTVNTNVDFDVEIIADWVKEVKTRTASDKTVRFSIEANSSSDSRSTEITFTNKANNLSAKTTVTQEGKKDTGTNSGIDDMPTQDW